MEEVNDVPEDGGVELRPARVARGLLFEADGEELVHAAQKQPPLQGQG